MNSFFVLFWTVIVFASVAWYAILLVMVGSKGGRELRDMVRKLSERPDSYE